MPNLTADRDEDRVRQEAADWCLRLRSGRPTAAEKAAFAAWLGADPAHADEYAAVEKTWALATRMTPAATGALGAAPVAQAAPPVREPARRPAGSRLVKVAALLAATVLLAFVGWTADWIPRRVDLQRAASTVSQGRLPDGSSVDLNVGTTLLYAEFRTRRRAWLFDGEAVFDVAPDSTQPFEITTDSARVTVTGTRFNVWSDPQQLIVTLETGRLLVQDAALSESVDLTSGEQVVFYPGRGTARVSRVDTANAFAWRDGKLVLDDVSLAHALPMINRYLATPLRLGDAGLSERRISGIYAISQLDRLPAALSAMLGLHLVRQGSDLVLFPG